MFQRRYIFEKLVISVAAIKRRWQRLLNVMSIHERSIGKNYQVIPRNTDIVVTTLWIVKT